MNDALDVFSLLNFLLAISAFAMLGKKTFRLVIWQLHKDV
jgi:hypothetical protein